MAESLNGNGGLEARRFLLSSLSCAPARSLGLLSGAAGSSKMRPDGKEALLQTLEEKKAAALAFEARFAQDHFARLGVTREALYGLLQRYHQAFDTMGEVRLPAPSGGMGPPACSKGCAFCCRALIVVTAPEVFFLAEHLTRTRDEKSLVDLKRRVSDVDRVTRGEAGDARWRRGPPCPLLGESDNACSAYAGRPLACRGLLSSSVKGCMDAFAVRASDPRFAGARPFLFQNSEVFLRALAISLAAHGRPLYRLELNAALVAVWSTPDPLEKWLSGVDIFANARAPGASAPIG